MRIHTNGNVGIGTISPTHTLHTNTAASGVFIQREIASNAATLSEFNSHRSLIIKNRDSGSFLMFGGNGSRTDIQASDGAGSPTAKTIALNPIGGRVGIGIVAPDAPLHIEDSTSSAYGGIRVVGAGTGSGSTNVRQIADFGRTSSGSDSGVWLGGRTDETTAVIGAKTASGNIAFEVYQSGWQERMRIKNSGDVGIGTSSPAEKLEVNGSFKVGNLKIQNANGGRIGFNRNTANGAIYDSNYAAFQINGAYANADYMAFEAYTSGGVGTDAMAIRDNGNVGIGTTSPSYKLEIAEDTNGTANLLQLRNSDSTYAQTWLFSSDTSKDLIIAGSSGSGGIDLQPGTRGVKVNGSTVWHAGNDGSGSGLDADLLDGYHGNNYIGKNGNSYYQPNTWIDFNSSNAGLYWSGGSYAGWHIYPFDSQDARLRSGNSGAIGVRLETTGTVRGYVYANSSNQVGFLNESRNWRLKVPSSGSIYRDAHVIWDAGNDGAGSGLDADLLDGLQSGSYLRSDADDTMNARLAIKSGLHSTGGNHELSLLESMAIGPTNSNLVYFRYQGSAGNFAIQTYNNANTGELHLQPYGGDVGIGTNGPGHKLDVVGGSIRINDVGHYIYFGTNSSVKIGTVSGNSDDLYLGSADDVNMESNFIRFWRDGYYGSTEYNRLAFSDYSWLCNGSGSHKLGIGITNPSEKLHVVGNILATGNITANSDISLKDNITPIPNALDKVLQIRGVTYNRNDIEDNPKHVGVIAQEVEKVLPEVVSEGEDGIKSVAYGNMVSLLIEAIKEQQEQIDMLKEKLESK